ncbi:S1 family peptidase [Aestuariibaculum suncheonense]|uniref:Trypsin-like peptidase domain-containing protein n=1 Tax=Aestuariibaculum suncheonense TaxID=1028745 RepID=A0A8J6Q8G3_9FLAO|nr:serine protease [Aestuariibaculum suncheonense]MBD0836059.1 trypsin-like peptidase domain-containing protein [Aestuariibaculum suncheonense]
MRYILKTFIILAGISYSITSQGQELFKNNIRQYKVKLLGEAVKLIDSEEVLSADSMEVTFKTKGYDPVHVDLKSMKKKKLSPDKIYDQVSESIVIVSPAGRCGGLSENGVECKRIHTYPASGYIVNSDGIIVTNYHVVNSYTTKNNTTARDVLLVMLKDGRSFPVEEVLMADKSNDLAIIKINPKGANLKPLPIATKDANIGDPVYVVSHPKGYFYAFSSGMVTDKFSEINAGQYRNLMGISADFAAGSSGAAIIDQFGNVIGTVSYTKTLKYSDDAEKTQMVLKAIIPSSCLLKLMKEGN